MSYIGDFVPAATIDHKFTTVSSTGAPTTLTGSPAVSLYEGNSTTEITAGITLTTDFDGRTGLHNVRIVGGTAGLANAKDYAAIITAGTVDSVSMVGYRLFSFSVHNRSAHEAIYYGSVTGTSTTTTLVDSGLTQVDNHWNGRIVVFLTGTLKWQIGIITSFTAASDTLNFTTAFTSAPTVGDLYGVY